MFKIYILVCVHKCLVSKEVSPPPVVFICQCTEGCWPGESANERIVYKLQEKKTTQHVFSEQFSLAYSKSSEAQFRAHQHNLNNARKSSGNPRGGQGLKMSNKVKQMRKFTRETGKGS